MLENELTNREPGDGSGGPDQGAVNAGVSRGGVSSRPAGPPDPAPPAPSVPAVSFQPPQVLFQAPQPTVPAAAPPAPPSAEPAVGDDESNGSRPPRRRASRTKPDAEGAPPKQGGRAGRRPPQTAEDGEPAPAPAPDLPFSIDNDVASPGADPAETGASGADDLAGSDD